MEKQKQSCNMKRIYPFEETENEYRRDKKKSRHTYYMGEIDNIDHLYRKINELEHRITKLEELLKNKTNIGSSNGSSNGSSIGSNCIGNSQYIYNTFYHHSPNNAQSTQSTQSTQSIHSTQNRNNRDKSETIMLDIKKSEIQSEIPMEKWNFYIS